MDSGTLPVLEIRRVFDAPRKAVFAAWTEADALARWMGPGNTNTRVDALQARPGGKYRFVIQGEQGDHPVGGEFLEVVEDERLVFTWQWEAGEIAGVATVVELEFRDVDGGTEMTLVHRMLPTEKAREMHNEGWTSCLACLTEFLDK